uniref:Microtubule-associated protein Jupiter n=1 Tax=Ciona intestinalis TaxID=7719 RepID=I7JI07_CIOIN|nr:HN1-like protein [Ciona intestinalis]DAA01821.1 TPA_inf: HN1-like protein [Ciona intestinalis]|eukprot:NP_001041450.1 HN1-like protein [Ciona intestinalis]
MNYHIERPTSRVIRPPGGGSSNIFGSTNPEPDNLKPSDNPNYTSTVFDHCSKGVESGTTKSVVRRDPITGEVIDDGSNVKQTKQEENDEKEIETKTLSFDDKENSSVSDHEPHLGPIRSTSGVRCAQPPGGRSSITFG